MEVTRPRDELAIGMEVRGRRRQTSGLLQIITSSTTEQMHTAEYLYFPNTKNRKAIDSTI